MSGAPLPLPPHPSVTTKNVSRLCQESSGGKIAPRWESLVWYLPKHVHRSLRRVWDTPGKEDSVVKWVWGSLLKQQQKIVRALPVLSNGERGTCRMSQLIWLQTLLEGQLAECNVNTPLCSWFIAVIFQVRTLRPREVTCLTKDSVAPC